MNRQALSFAAPLLLPLFTLDAQARAKVSGKCDPLPRAIGAMIERGWSEFRANRMQGADSAFRRAMATCPNHVGAINGSAYVALRQGGIYRADTLFRRSLMIDSRDYDALTGVGMTAYRRGEADQSRAFFVRADRIFPNDSLIQSYLSKLPDRSAAVAVQRPGYKRPVDLRVDARVGWRRFEVPSKSGWEPFWIKGVNVGAALPGKHPSEFPPNDGTYEKWIELVASMGANTLRVYTIHPPHFYDALDRWNSAHPSQTLWLIHGVWTELPPGAKEEKYDDPEWRNAFRAEGRNVVDLLHGRAELSHRAGHASGSYRTDVSRWVLAFITGREWEPYSVVAYSKQHPNETSYAGRFVQLANGNAAEVWLAEESDVLLRYEAETYNTIRPIAYTNWPTLDPLYHPTESTQEEEAKVRRWTLPEASLEFDNDAIGLDATRMRATQANPAGTFASFHAYPYYPDFMVLDPGYAKAKSPEGPSAYFGYLDELVRHHGDMPVVISEYGVPSSRGNAHWQPQGWNHGGHSEEAQANIDARLTRDIHAAGAAGAILFAVIDEWFKKNWVVIDFEQPLERNRLWLNALDAEQNYGILAMLPGPRDLALTIDGNRADWGARGKTWPHFPAVSDKLAPPLRIDDVRVTSDEGYLYLRLDVGAIDWNRGRYVIGLDTHLPNAGSRILPRTGTACSAGLEFALDLVGPKGSQLLVDRPYNLYRGVPLPGTHPPQAVQVYNRPWQSIAHPDAQWDTLVVETNRARVGRDGTEYPRKTYMRNALAFAKQTETTLADWYADPTTGVIEVRLGWGMLHVLDPSSRFVLSGTEVDGRSPAGIKTDGFRVVVASYDPAKPDKSGMQIGCGGQSAPFLYTWAEWEEPKFHVRRKPLFEAMRDTYRGITGPFVAQPAAVPAKP